MKIEIPIVRAAVMVVLTVAVLLACYLSPKPEFTNNAGVEKKLPMFLDKYLGEEIKVSEAERHILPEDTEFARMRYRGLRGEEFVASIVLSGTQKRSIHRPEVCLPAQGWIVTSGEVVTVKLSNDLNLPVMKLMLEREVPVGNKKEKIRSVFMYWFVGKDKTTPHHWERIFLTSWDKVVYNLSHRWAYVSVNSTVTGDFHPEGKNLPQTVEMLKNYISEAVPKFQIAGIQTAQVQ